MVYMQRCTRVLEKAKQKSSDSESNLSLSEELKLLKSDTITAAENQYIKRLAKGVFSRSGLELEAQSSEQSYRNRTDTSLVNPRSVSLIKPHVEMVAMKTKHRPPR